MNETLSQYLQKLQEMFNGQQIEFAGEPSVILPRESVQAAARLIHDDFGFELLSFVTAVDYWPQEDPRFHVIYRFTGIKQKLTLNLRVPVPGIAPSLSTVEMVYRNANWHEREVYDMFGIQFEGHSDMRRLLMPTDWEGYPQRKDYPLGYEEPQYSFNFDEIAVRKPHAREEAE